MKWFNWLKRLVKRPAAQEVAEKVKAEAGAIVADVAEEVKDIASDKVTQLGKKARKRARDAKGRFLRDDPATEKNEAYDD